MAAVALHLQNAQALLGHGCQGFCRLSRSTQILRHPPVINPFAAIPSSNIRHQHHSSALCLSPTASLKSVSRVGISGGLRDLHFQSFGVNTGLRFGVGGDKLGRGVLGVRMAAGGAADGRKREIMVQHLLVKEEDEKLLTELQQRILNDGEDLGTLAAEHSVCPSKRDGGMLGWVKKGMMVPEFEDAAFGAKLNRPVKVKTKFGWHLLQVLSEREPTEVVQYPVEELHVRLQEGLSDDVQLMDVREPSEVERASLPGFRVYPLSQFGDWAPTLDLDPNKETIVLCHHGMRSLQAATWLISQGFKDVKNVTGGIDLYSKNADSSVPQY